MDTQQEQETGVQEGVAVNLEPPRVQVVIDRGGIQCGQDFSDLMRFAIADFRDGRINPAQFDGLTKCHDGMLRVGTIEDIYLLCNHPDLENDKDEFNQLLHDIFYDEMGREMWSRIIKAVNSNINFVKQQMAAAKRHMNSKRPKSLLLTAGTPALQDQPKLRANAKLD